MTFARSMFRLAAVALCSAATTGVPELAYAERHEGPVVVAAADCYRAAQRVAAERGGRVHSARAATRNGRTVCVVVVVVPGRDGQRGRVIEVEVPAD